MNVCIFLRCFKCVKKKHRAGRWFPLGSSGLRFEKEAKGSLPNQRDLSIIGQVVLAERVTGWLAEGLVLLCAEFRLALETVCLFVCAQGSLDVRVRIRGGCGSPKPLSSVGAGVPGCGNMVQGLRMRKKAGFTHGSCLVRPPGAGTMGPMLPGPGVLERRLEN